MFVSDLAMSVSSPLQLKDAAMWKTSCKSITADTTYINDFMYHLFTMIYTD